MMVQMMRLCAVAGALTVSMRAWGHHFMDGTLPSTPMEGFISGVAHPVIGLDHLAFVVGIGVLGALVGRRYSLPGAFLLASVFGVVLHLWALNIPMLEVILSASVVLCGAVVLLGRESLQGKPWLWVLAATGMLHGYAYGESIVGAEVGQLSSYVVGFTLCQFAVALASGALVDLTRSKWTPVAGGAIVGVGLTFLHAQGLTFLA